MFDPQPFLRFVSIARAEEGGRPLFSIGSRSKCVQAEKQAEEIIANAKKNRGALGALPGVGLSNCGDPNG